MLADLARPQITIYYEPWQREVTYRRLSAQQYIDIMQMQTVADDEDKSAQVKMFAMLCSLAISDPQATADEWATESTLNALVDLGTMVLQESSQLVGEDAKKN